MLENLRIIKKFKNNCMKNPDQFINIPNEQVVSKKETKQEKRARLISQYVEKEIVGASAISDEEAMEISEGAKDMSVGEKAVRIYEDMMSFWLSRKNDAKQVQADPYLADEMSFLWKDEAAKEIFLKKYLESRLDIKKFGLSELKDKLKEKEGRIIKEKNKVIELERNLNLGKLKNPIEIRAAQRKIEYKKKIIHGAEIEKDRILTLEGYDYVKENTDVAALSMYDMLRRYHDEAKTGFVWLPSRRDNHKKIIETIKYSGKAPFLIGPPGTGKTTQINAVAVEFTGDPAVMIPCHNGLSEEGLIANRDIKKGEGAWSYEGTVAEAATGYMCSQDAEPAYDHGRMAVLDEGSQLNFDKALGPIKNIRQAKPGKQFSRYVPRPVLNGFQLAMTSNLPISDERVEREFGRIPTNYFEMNENNPELYEFMLAKLMQAEGHLPAIDKSILEPKYDYKEILEEQRKKREDGSVIAGADELRKDCSDKEHGYLYRLSYAIRAIQDSYIHGSKFNEKHLANTALYENFDDKGKVVIKGYITDLQLADASSATGGEMLMLRAGSSTFTPEIISKWIDGYLESNEKDLVKWIQKMLQDHINQTTPEDGERIAAIANYFHLFDSGQSKRGLIQPLTPKEIGYLSPRVPRPVHIIKPVGEATEKPDGVDAEDKSSKEYETIQVLLEDGSRIAIKKSEINLSSAEKPDFARLGDEFVYQGEEYIFAGVVGDEASAHNGKPVGKPANGEDLHKIFSQEELLLGVAEKFNNDNEANLVNLEANIEDFCRT